MILYTIAVIGREPSSKKLSNKFALQTLRALMRDQTADLTVPAPFEMLPSPFVEFVRGNQTISLAGIKGRFKAVDKLRAVIDQWNRRPSYS